MRKRHIVHTILACFVTIFLLAQGIADVQAAKPVPTMGTLKGKVTIAGTNTAIVGAFIEATGAQETFSASSDSRGNYSMTMPAGNYNVTASSDGFSSQTFPVTMMAGTKTVQSFALLEAVASSGTITGTVTDSASGYAIAGATVTADSGGFNAVTDSSGNYIIHEVTAGTYYVTAAASGFQSLTLHASVTPDTVTYIDFGLAAEGEAVSITSLTATPNSFSETQAASITLAAEVEGFPATFEWNQVAGPKVPLSGTSATSAEADVSELMVAAETSLIFNLTLDGSVSQNVSVTVLPVDMFPFLGEDVQVGGSSTSVARFQSAGSEWCLFNIGTELKATPVGVTQGAIYSIFLPEFAFGIEIVAYNGATYALVATGGAGITVVDITEPADMSVVSITPVNYYLDNVTFTETGGAILPDNIMESSAAPIVDLVTDGTDLYIADNQFGIHKTALANLFNQTLETDGTLLIDQEVSTVQYAGEHPWGGPVSLKLYGGKLFSALGVLGLGIFDPVSLEQIGSYNLYTDESRVEDYFGAMAVTQAVSSDPVTGDLFLDDYTGMPDYRQVSYEITMIMKGAGLDEPIPWADMERDGKWYYEALDLDISLQASRTIAYIAYSLGGVIAVDVTGFETATAANLLTAPYLAYYPTVPVNGPYDTGSNPSSLLPYEGAGKLKESGVTGVAVNGNQLYLTDHFAGLVILDNAATPDLDWQGTADPYNNDTDGIADNNIPDYEDITTYDMSPWDPLDNESLPQCFYDAPSLLATRELKGHGYTLALMDSVSLTETGSVDVLECSGAGGFVFVDITDIYSPDMYDRFDILVYFPSTDETGAAVDGSATQTIAIGHAAGVDASDNYLYVSDGPHGVTAWNITDELGFPTDEVHLVANTLQDEYPINDIYPASHTVRNVIDSARDMTWALCVGNGLRRVPIKQVEEGLGTVGAPLLMELSQTDSFEHNADWGSLKVFPYQDQAYDVEFVGDYAYVADGSNGLTIYNVTKDPTKRSNGYFIGNIGYNQGSPLLGTASGIELWSDSSTGKLFAVLASGSYGVGVVDVTNMNAMQLVKVFEPIKYENDELGSADGQAIDVEVIGDIAYFTYDSFGVISYAMSDLVTPVPEGVDPTELFKKEDNGTIVYDYRPEFLGRFKLQWVPGYEAVSGGAVRMDYTEAAGMLHLYVAFHEAGVIKINFTDPTNPLLVDRHDTASEAVDVTIANGRLYVADGTGGLVFLK